MKVYTADLFLYFVIFQFCKQYLSILLIISTQSPLLMRNAFFINKGPCSVKVHFIFSFFHYFISVMSSG